MGEIMKLKKIFASILLFAMTVSFFVPISSYAANTVTIYNCGEEVETVNTNNINELYVDVDRLSWYDIECKDNSDHLYLYNGYKAASVYRNSNIVNVSGTNLTYYNSIVEKSGNEHISLALLSMVFSQNCEITADSINLWMPYYPDNYAKGIISLPGSSVAPVGGIKVTVGVYKKVHTYVYDSENPSVSSGKVSPSVGYDGVDWFEKEYFNYTKENLAEQTVVIEEGKNSVQYFLSSEDTFGMNSYVYYKVEDNGFADEEKLSFSYKEDVLYNFCIGENKSKISGAIILSEPSDVDVDFCLIADGTKDYELYGTIPAGETVFEYSLNVSNDATYKIRVLFDEKAYKRTEYSEKLYIEDADVNGVDLYCEPSSKISVNVMLPDNMIRDEDTTGYLFLQSSVKPYYHLDNRSFKIPAGQTNAVVELIDERGFDEFYVFYEFKQDEVGLYNFGFYNSKGTTIEHKSMESFGSDEKIKIKLIEAKEIYTDIVLPNEEVAGSYIDATLELVSANEIKPLIEVNSCETNEYLNEVLVKYENYFDLSEYEMLDAEQKEYVLNGLREKKYNSVEEFQGVLKKLIKRALISSGGSFGVVTDKGDTTEDGEDVTSLPPLQPSEEENVVDTTVDITKGDVITYNSRAVAYPVITTEEQTIRLMSKGMSTATVCVRLPLTADSFILKISYISDENYYPQIYYNSKKGSTIFAEYAGLLDKNSDNIEVSLMPINTISGTVTNSTDYKNLEVMAVYQDKLSSLKEYTDSKFVCSTSEFGENGEYVIRVPAELSDYTVMLKGEERNIYYNLKGNTENLKEAGIVDSLENPDNINFEYWGYDPANPIKLHITENNDGRIIIEADNISDYEKTNVNIHLAMYDETGRLIDIDSEVIDVIPANGTNFAYFRVAYYDIQEASTVKVFAWSDGLKPYSEIEYIKENGIGSEQKTAMLWMKSGSSTIGVYGDEITVEAEPMMMNNVLMSTARPLAEALYLDAYWEAESNSMMFKYESNIMTLEIDNSTAIFNGEPFELSNPACMHNGRVYVPVTDVAEKFGYDTEFDYDTCELFVFYGAINELVKAAKYREYMPQYIFEKDLKESLTRYDAAQLLVSLCETVIADELELTGATTYSDTDDVNILKLSDAGILKGINDGEFGPGRIITNAEFVTVLCRALTYIEENIPDEVEKAEYFYNHNDIPLWARDTVYMMKLYGALEGVYNQIFAGTSPTTVEEAIAVIENAFRQSYDTLFLDIDSASGYKETVIRLSKLGIMFGYEDGTFRPDGQVMRSEFATIITRMLGIDESAVKTHDGSCDDVDATHWAVHYIGYCVDNGIIELENNCYRPDEPITNKEVIWGLMRALGYTKLTSFTDVYNTAEEIGLFKKLEALNTDNKSNRIEVAQMIYNALNLNNVG